MNYYVDLTFSGLQETKQVIGHDAEAGDFQFSVQAMGDDQSGTTADEAAKLAGFDKMPGYDAEDYALTFSNGESISDEADAAAVVRTANQLTLTAANVGKTYVYEYRELASDDPAWHQQKETVWRVSVAVSWVDEAREDAIQAVLTLKKSTDGGETWSDAGSKTYTSTDETHAEPLTVSFVNEYGSTLQIKKTDQDGNALVGATFRVRNEEGSYQQEATTVEVGGEAIATFKNIPDGSYVISETNVPAGYLPSLPGVLASLPGVLRPRGGGRGAGEPGDRGARGDGVLPGAVRRLAVAHP